MHLQKIVRLVVLMFVIAYSSACTNILELLDTGVVGKFTILSHSPEMIQLGEPFIEKDTIYIPFNYGIEEIKRNPLVIKAEIELKEGIGLRNINTDSIVFQANGLGEIEPFPFYVESQSGMVRKYLIKLKVKPLSTRAEVVSCYVKSIVNAPEGTILADSAVITDLTQEVKIFMPKGGFPVTIQPDFVVSDTAKVLYPERLSQLTFNNEEDRVAVDVQSASGRVSTWHLSVKRGYEYIPNSGDYIDPYTMELISFSAQELTATASGTHQISSVSVDNEKGIVWLNVKNTDPSKLPSQLTLPLEVTLQFPMIEPRFCVGYTPLKEIPFKTLSDEKEIFLYHAVYNYKRRWRVKIQSWKNEDNRLQEFKITKYVPAQLNLDDQVEINHTTGSIVIPLDGDKNFFPLQILTNLKLPQGATLPNASLTNQRYTFATLKSKATLKVVSESGIEKSYTLSLRYKGELNTEADIEGFSMLEYTSTNNRVKLADQCRIDHAKRQIEIEVLDWANYFPLRIRADIGYSYGASITPAIDASSWITFQNVNSSYSFTITSEDTNKSALWTIVLKNSEPAKSNEARITHFEPMQIETGYQLTPQNSTVVDQNKREITIYVLSKSDTKKFSFIPQIIISDNAKLEGLVPGARITFSSFNEEKYFYVISESEVIRNQWKIRTVYAPQLPSTGFEQVSGNVPSGWCSANNTYVTCTTIQNGPTGKAARLETKSAPIVNIKAAGSLYLGRFNFDIGLQNKPKKMTYFGIPFSARPKSMSVDMAYRSISTGQGPDKAAITIELLNWSGTGDIVYHDDDENADKIKKVGTARILLDDNGFEWKNYVLNIQYDSRFANTPVTHISVVFSSSYRGDEFVAGVGSTLMVDNVTLNY